MNRIILLIVSLSFAILAQTVKFDPDSISRRLLWQISDSTELYVGASFYYMDPSDSIVVWLQSSESDMTGNLYCMVPGYADSALFLFTNQQSGARINLTNALRNPLRPGTEIFFMYRRQNANNNRYTGQNRYGIDPQNQSVYPGARFVARDFGVRPGFGHRWSVAGRILDTSGHVTDTIVFGFEDEGVRINPFMDSLVTSDFDFNDVIFKVTGLTLNVETIPDSLSLIFDKDTVSAGDFIMCRAQVWSDSAGQKVRSPQFDSLVTWTLTGLTVHADTMQPGNQPGSMFFHGRSAFQNFSICASFLFHNDTISTCRSVYVKPGRPAQLSIELIADTSVTGFSFNRAIELPQIQLPSNLISRNVFALFRDTFGNFVQTSNNTVWDTSSSFLQLTLNPGIATVRTGRAALGEGIIERNQGNGNIGVFAKGVYEQDTLSDTVLVSVATVSYDSIRIGLLNNTGITFNSAITFSIDSCVNLITQGRRIDTGIWEPVSVIWSTSGSPANKRFEAQPELRFCPDDTGTGIIEATFQQFLYTQLRVKVIPGAPAQLQLCTDKGKPFPLDTTIQAGYPVNMIARIFDSHGIWLTNTVPADSIFWNLVEHDNLHITDSSGQFNVSNGSSATYIPKRAYRTVTIDARYQSFSDSVKIHITPGKPFRVVIESHANWHQTPNSPDEIDTVEIPDNKTSATVYALLRDSLRNFVDILRSGTWEHSDTIINIMENQPVYTGIIQRNIAALSGICQITVKHEHLIDTAFVKLLPYHYIQLEIFTEPSTPIESLTLSTNEDTTLYARALRSDTTLWRVVPVTWTMSEELTSYPAPGSHSSSFLFSPVKPGQGFIYAQLPGSYELSDTVSVTAIRGEPLRAEFVILSPNEKCIAGDSIRAVVRIFNEDGLVPGIYCYSRDSLSGPSLFQDQLGIGTYNLRPQVISGSSSALINTYPSTSSGLDQCFTDGTDTISFILYHAPFEKDSLHRIWVTLGNISAFSSSFHLKPSSLHSLSIAHTQPCCPDSLKLRYPSGQVLLYAIGYDRFGNMRGSELGYWNTTGSLHEIEHEQAVSRVIYGADSGKVISDESGYAVVVSATDSLVSDSLFIAIIGPRGTITDAKSFDKNGNGYLDQIRLMFDMPIFVNSRSLSGVFSIQYKNTHFPIDSMLISEDSLSMILYLREQITPSLQTNWTPSISMHNKDYALGGATDSGKITAADGAGPVIVSVVKNMGNKRIQDLVAVSFSEKILGPQGKQFSLLQLPEEVFYTWIVNSAKEYERLPLLKGIGHFNTPLRSDSVFFTTSNGSDLTTRHYFNLRTDSAAYVITDLAGNPPVISNRKVRVDVHGTASQHLTVFPNPGRATSIREKPGEFHITHNKSAIEWVTADKAGIVLQFELSLQENRRYSVSGHIAIYDMVGNEVCSDPVTDYKWTNLFNSDAVGSNYKSPDIIPASWSRDGSVHNYYIYWNGFTKSGARAAPGVYQAVLKLFIKDNGKEKQEMYKALIGIKQ